MRRTLSYLAAALAAAAPLAMAQEGAGTPGSPSGVTTVSSASPAAPLHDGTLRVCADPDNLPFSNRQEQGFENKIAQLLAKELGGKVTYTWWPARRGFVRNTLRAKECDLLVGVPKGFDPVLETRPLYRSTYYFVTRADRKLRIASLDDPVLRGLKIGVNLIGEDYTNTPPAHALGSRGITVARGYPTFYNAEQRPEDIIQAVTKGDIDVAIVWGPLAGYFAARQDAPLTLAALPDSDSTGLPFAYDIALGVRRSDKAFKARIEEVLERTGPEIARILSEFSVPTVGARR